MTHFEYMESQGQLNIFEFLPIKTTQIRNNAFVEGDKVKIRYYSDEVGFIRNCHPQLLEQGVIVAKRYDFYRVQIGEVIVDVPGEKLKLV